MSEREGSNVCAEAMNTRDVLLIRMAARQADTKATMARCCTNTHLGTPVDPDVYTAWQIALLDCEVARGAEDVAASVGVLAVTADMALCVVFSMSRSSIAMQVGMLSLLFWELWLSEESSVSIRIAF